MEAEFIGLLFSFFLLCDYVHVSMLVLAHIDHVVQLSLPMYILGDGIITVPCPAG